jgi:hypothetical protein
MTYETAQRYVPQSISSILDDLEWLAYTAYHFGKIDHDGCEIVLPRHEAMTNRFKRGRYWKLASEAVFSDDNIDSSPYRPKSHPARKPRFRADLKKQRQWAKWRASVPNKGRKLREMAEVADEHRGQAA